MQRWTQNVDQKIKRSDEVNLWEVKRSADGRCRNGRLKLILIVHLHQNVDNLPETVAHKVTEDDSCYYLHPNTFLINIPAIPDLCYYCPKTDHQIKVKKNSCVSACVCWDWKVSREAGKLCVVWLPGHFCEAPLILECKWEIKWNVFLHYKDTLDVCPLQSTVEIFHPHHLTLNQVK